MPSEAIHEVAMVGFGGNACLFMDNNLATHWKHLFRFVQRSGHYTPSHSNARERLKSLQYAGMWHYTL